MNTNGDIGSEERSENISCLFCAIVPILMFVVLFLLPVLHLTWYEGVIFFLSPLLLGLLLLYIYERKAFWNVMESAVD